MTSEEISKIGVVKTENEAKVKIPVSEYRDLIEAVEKLRHVAEEEHTNYMRSSREFREVMIHFSWTSFSIRFFRIIKSSKPTN